MGACCSCCGQGSADDGSSASEMEMRAQNAEAEAKVLSVARGMSAPSIEVVDRTKVSIIHLVKVFRPKVFSVL